MVSGRCCDEQHRVRAGAASTLAFSVLFVFWMVRMECSRDKENFHSIWKVVKMGYDTPGSLSCQDIFRTKDRKVPGVSWKVLGTPGRTWYSTARYNQYSGFIVSTALYARDPRTGMIQF